MEYLWIWMSIKVPCRNPTFGGFIIWAKAQRIRLTFNSLHVHRRAFCQRAPREYLKKLSQIKGRMSAFQIFFHATQVKRRSGLCNVFSSLFYFSVLVIARLNGCYYVGGSVSKPAWSNRKICVETETESTAGELISAACFQLRLYYFHYSLN